MKKFSSLTVVSLFCTAGFASAATVIDINTDGGNAASTTLGSVDNGTVAGVTGQSLNAAGAVISDNGENIEITYVVTGLDLSAEQAGATNVGFSFSVSYTGVNNAGNPADVSLGTSGNIGVTGQTGGTEILTAVVNAPTMITGGFLGTIAVTGFTEFSLANFANNDGGMPPLPNDAADITFNDSAMTTLNAAGTGGFPGFVSVPFPSGVTLIEANSFTHEATTGSNTVGSFTTRFTATAIPEPSSTLLLGLGGFAFLVRRRR